MKLFPAPSFFLVSLAAFLLNACQPKGGTALNPDVDYYTCTMHPSVHSHDPNAKCPICSMDLVAVMKKGAQVAAPKTDGPELTEFSVPVERQQQIGVTYAPVTKGPLNKSIRSVGMVATDRTRRWEFVARVEGYLQQLNVTSPGETVEKNQPLLTFYSPDLLTTQQSFINALELREHAGTAEARASANREVAAGRVRMEQWNVTPEQVTELEKGRKPSQYLTLRSPFRGVVESVPVEQGRRLMVGDPLVSVADLSDVWIWAEFYENEVPLLKPGIKVTLTANAYPGQAFEGKIALVNPFLSEMQRTAKVRVDVQNPYFKLRPGMFVNLLLECAQGDGLTIPVAAIMPTGARTLAFVDKGGGKLEPRAVELGGKFGDVYEVKSGLKEGERVVTSANFLIDAESKVQGAVKNFEEPVQVRPALSEAASAAYQKLLLAYMVLEQDLAKDSLPSVPAAVATLRERAATLSLQSEAGPALAVTHLKNLDSALAKFDLKTLEEARVHFGQVSASLIALLNDVPAPLPELYVMNCPMWRKSPGDWLQTSQDVQNPFMGQKMSGCGDLVKTLAHAK